MPRSLRQLPARRFLRRIACATAVIFLWLSAGAILTHTDACFDALAPILTLARHSVVTPASASLTHDACAACEWTALQILSPITFVLAFAVLVTQERRVFLLRTAICRRIVFASLRAPPCSL